MFNFGRQAKEARQSSGSFSYFKNNVNVTRLTAGKDGRGVLFKILPAHDPSTINVDGSGGVNFDPMSWVPCRDANGDFAPWGRMITVLPNVGHGSFKARETLVSMRTLADGDENVYCPLEELVSEISKEPYWAYLSRRPTDEEKDAKAEDEAVKSFLPQELIMNGIDIGRAGRTSILYANSVTAIRGLIGEHGVMFQRNPQATEDDVSNDPNAAWLYGDITHPGKRGYVFEVKRDTDSRKGKYAGLVIDVAVQDNNVPMRYVVPQDRMAERKCLADIKSIINVPTVENLVAKLVTLLDRWAPDGNHHEWELLRSLFGSVAEIPDPPTKGASPGFGQPPAGAQASVENPGGGGFKHPPVSGSNARRSADKSGGDPYDSPGQTQQRDSNPVQGGQDPYDSPQPQRAPQSEQASDPYESSPVQPAPDGQPQRPPADPETVYGGDSQEPTRPDNRQSDNKWLVDDEETTSALSPAPRQGPANSQPAGQAQAAASQSARTQAASQLIDRLKNKKK